VAPCSGGSPWSLTLPSTTARALVVAIVLVAHLGSDVATTEAFDLDVSVPAFSNILPTD
jgi:hypothetical protein